MRIVQAVHLVGPARRAGETGLMQGFTTAAGRLKAMLVSGDGWGDQVVGRGVNGGRRM